MLHVALAGLIAGSLALTPPDGPGDEKKTPNTDKQAPEAAALPGVFETGAQAEAPEAVVIDTYAMGRAVGEAPIKIWAQYAYGVADEIYDRSGDSQTLGLGGGVTLPNGVSTARPATAKPSRSGSPSARRSTS